MKALIILIFACLSFSVYGQKTMKVYTGFEKIYLDYAEIDQTLYGRSVILDSFTNLSKTDTLLYTFKIEAYPDATKRYSIQNTIAIKLTGNKNRESIVFTPVIQNDSGSIIIPIPSDFGDDISISVYCFTFYKKNKWKEPKTVKDKVLDLPHYRLYCYGRYCEGVALRRSCGVTVSKDMLNDVMQKSPYPIDDLVIRTMLRAH